jgi:hydroxymethylpyrimidine pyrophosphatase-like HAD family hydrolase
MKVKFMKQKLSRDRFNASAITYDYRIVTPETAVVTTSPDIGFIYIMRKDTAAVCDPLSQKISSQYQIPTEQVRETIRPLYLKFVDGLSHAIARNLTHKGRVEIHLYDPERIDTHRFSYLNDQKAISLDPLVQAESVATIGLSRGYLPGGKIEIGMMPRPGHPSLHEQILLLKEKISAGDEIDIFEDDIYTGGSLTRVVNMLAHEGIRVKNIIPGIQIGTSQSLISLGIEINPAVRYHIHAGQDIDLGDPRDFLLGADGLVVMLNGNQLGRLPYIAPFVSPAARLSIPKENEIRFSLDVLALNQDFFTEVERALSISVELTHLNESSAFALGTLVPEWKSMRLADVVSDIINNYKSLQKVCDYHRDHSAIKMLGLPKNIVFLDVNGTLLPSTSRDGYIAAQDLEAFQNAVIGLEKTGMVVGLNSDSPLPQLRDFSKRIGIPNAPIIAENGAVISYKENSIGLRHFDNIDILKSDIRKWAEKNGFSQAENLIAPEFGGNELPAGLWAFGANRTNSISIFGSTDFIAGVRELINKFQTENDINCDYSPNHGFIGIHAGRDFRQGKAEMLEKLVNEGHRIVSIGDSVSDYASLPLPNKVVFVQDGIPADILSMPHVSITKEKGIAGVVETLKSLANTGIEPRAKQSMSYDI